MLRYQKNVQPQKTFLGKNITIQAIIGNLYLISDTK